MHSRLSNNTCLFHLNNLFPLHNHHHHHQYNQYNQVHDRVSLRRAQRVRLENYGKCFGAW